MEGYLDKDQWEGFCDDLAKTHEDYEACLEVIGRAFGHKEEAAWLPFAGMSYDPHHDQLFITLGGMSSRYPVHLTHMIDGPRQIHCRGMSAGDMRSILIVAPDKTETLLRLRPAVTPEHPS